MRGWGRRWLGGTVTDAHKSIVAGSDLSRPGRDRRHDLAIQKTAWSVNMRCKRRKELELRYLNQTEDYIAVIERQNRMFRNGENQSARAIHGAIFAAKK